ncbi:class F sortase [Nocardioides sp. zg-1230]|uniref:class F sortase n=1 Tax=Nocardioides sp. zg-1230 TaxID=2736601 RepID=UPI001553DA7C|nr:class F sortase [Nocardioides sp. zg-1230]NPC43561.1 class F sortase [Nocardioides sp. zg-1230]
MSARPRALMLSACLVVVTAGCASGDVSTRPAAGSSVVPPSASAPSAPASSTSAAEPVAPARRAGSVVTPRRPTRATLPSGRDVRVTTAGTTGSGVLDVPDDVDVAGWWRGGSRIGDPFGSILVAAHVDSDAEGLGPFAELLTVREGARVRLEGDGLRQDFRIGSRRLVAQGSLVDDGWIFDASGDLRLALVTCAPPYDASRGGYQNLAVVTAVPLGPPEAT